MSASTEEVHYELKTIIADVEKVERLPIMGFVNVMDETIKKLK